MQDKRMYPRYVCTGGVELSVPDSSRRVWGHLADISRNGFYMESAEPWTIGTEVVVRLEAENSEIYASAKIVTCHPGVGMGLVLVRIYSQYQADFDRLLTLLASDTEEIPSQVVPR